MLRRVLLKVAAASPLAFLLPRAETPIPRNDVGCCEPDCPGESWALFGPWWITFFRDAFVWGRLDDMRRLQACRRRNLTGRAPFLSVRDVSCAKAFYWLLEQVSELDLQFYEEKVALDSKEHIKGDSPWGYKLAMGDSCKGVEIVGDELHWYGKYGMHCIIRHDPEIIFTIQRVA